MAPVSASKPFDGRRSARGDARSCRMSCSLWEPRRRREVPVESFGDPVVRVGDVPVERHRHECDHLGPWCSSIDGDGIVLVGFMHSSISLVVVFFSLRRHRGADLSGRSRVRRAESSLRIWNTKRTGTATLGERTVAERQSDMRTILWLQTHWLDSPARQDPPRVPGINRHKKKRRLISGHLRQDLDVPVRSMHTDPPISDQPGGLLHPTTAGRPLPCGITALWVIRPPTSVTRPDRDEQGRPAGIRMSRGPGCRPVRYRPQPCPGRRAPAPRWSGKPVGRPAHRAGRSPGRYAPAMALAVRRLALEVGVSACIRPERLLALTD